jgi:hypothetical protein
MPLKSLGRSDVEPLCQYDLVELVCCSSVARECEVVGGLRPDAYPVASASSISSSNTSSSRYALPKPSTFDEEVGYVCICVGVIATARIAVFFNPSAAETDSHSLSLMLQSGIFIAWWRTRPTNSLW